MRHHLSRHAVETAYEKGWGGLKNGDLLTRAEAEGFDALVTTDQNLRYQQNLSGRQIGVVVLLTTSRPRIRKHVALVARALDNLPPGGYEEVAFP